MSVIDFFSTYWDWYLLSVFFAWIAFMDDWSVGDLFASLLVALIWPVQILQFFYASIRKP